MFVGIMIHAGGNVFHMQKNFIVKEWQRRDLPSVNFRRSSSLAIPSWMQVRSSAWSKVDVSEWIQ